MRHTVGYPWAIRALGAVLALSAGCGSDSTPDFSVARIYFEPHNPPAGGTGQAYSFVLECGAEGGAAMPDRFEIEHGVLPAGVQLVPDRDDNNHDGYPDPDGELTGHARLIGYPRAEGTFTFTVKAVTTRAVREGQARLAATATFTLTIDQGSITLMTPTAAEGTIDPAVPAFPEVVDFVNPANPQGFFSLAFQLAGGSGSNIATVYLPRELELSVFDDRVVDGAEDLGFDSDETLTSGDKNEVDPSDGGWFTLQAGDKTVQIGGFQSPRGPVGTITNHAGGPGLNPEWFQRASAAGGPALSSRRDLEDSLGLGSGDTLLGTPLPVRFSDYFDPLYEGTHADFELPTDGPKLQRRKYPFTSDQYANAFFVDFTPGVDVTELRYRIIVEAIDTRGTTTKDDDVIVRKAYIAQVQIQPIRIDTVQLPGGQAGVDYAAFLNVSGGVPPLRYELEFVDGTLDEQVTDGDPLTKQDFGVEIDPDTAQFFGVPRASGAAEFTLVASADVLSPNQAGPGFEPTHESPGEYTGVHPVTGKAGVHRTYAVHFAPPTAPSISNPWLAAGLDGRAYPGDWMRGAGGVPKLLPYPVGFERTYPASLASRNYEYTASYIRDASHGADAGTVDPRNPLPKSLVFDGDPDSATNGQISGVATDRGFHTITFVQTDFYLGDAGSPTPAERQTTTTVVALGVSPDSAVYLRGVPAAQGGVASGLLDGSAQMAEPRMVPMFCAGALHTVAQGATPQQPLAPFVPAAVDFLPLMLANGGSDAHVDKSIPSVSGFWPAEADKESRWWYYAANVGELGWKHLQQETCWIQTPTAEHRRVYLWAETKLKSYRSGATSGADSKRYQQYDRKGQRGVLIQDPRTGEFWVPAILDNAGPDHGRQFGAECVLSCSGDDPDHYRYGHIYGGYARYYGYLDYTRGDREFRLGGLGSFIESTESSSGGRQLQGRGATSVAVSADGLWAATALPGGNVQMILLWRTDKQPIPDAILSRPYVRSLTGKDSDGSDLPHSACILDLGGEYASGHLIEIDQRYLLPDSLMFVRDGLIFLMEKHLDRIFGISLVDGHLSSKDVNARTALSAVQHTGPSCDPTLGQYIPDQDYLRGQKATCDYAVQFSFTGNAPLAGEEGPDRIAFVAGDNRNLYAFADYPSSYTDLSSDAVRKGYAMGGKYGKALLFLETSTGAGGLDLAASTLKDLTGQDGLIHGNLLTPGRPGEELDFLTVSPDGKYVAVVRDINDSSIHSSNYFGRAHTFATSSRKSTSAYHRASDDILLFSTTGADLDAAPGTQTVLYIGSGNYTPSYVGTPLADAVTYASARAYLNAMGRRICGVRFSADSKTLIFTYAGHDSYWTKFFGHLRQCGVNSHPGQRPNFVRLTAQASLRVQFRTASDEPIDFGTDAAPFMRNNLSGLTGVPAIGPTTPPFTATTSSDQQFWATFRSPNGTFLYYVSDQIGGRNHMVGLNTSASRVGGHDPYVPFSPHPGTIGFEQFDVNSFNYDNRFCAVPGGVTYRPSGRDGAGIVFVIASDSSAGATSATDLEVYAFDANVGGGFVTLTADVTDGTSNAINHLYASANGNHLVGQRCKTTVKSGATRAALNGNSDLFVVADVHAALDGVTPNAFVLSEAMSHGSTVAFVGESTDAGPRALVFSAGPRGDNQSWDNRTLQTSLLQPDAQAEILDKTESHYVVLAGVRKVNDNPDTSD